MFKIAFIGCVDFSSIALKHLLSLESYRISFDIIGIVTRDTSSFNTDFCSLTPVAIEYGIPFFLAKGNDQEEMYHWLSNKVPDVIYCFGWSFLIQKKILTLPRLGVIGYHPAELPKNRGRHPIIWSLVLGLNQIGSSFFFMDEGADSGDILSQKSIDINGNDNAKTIYEKLSKVACEQITSFNQNLICGNFTRIPQDHSRASYWRKRGHKDGIIDWKMSASSINNLIRALATPYPGASFYYQDIEYKAWESRLYKGHLSRPNLEPGKIIDLKCGFITIKCGGGAIIITNHTCKADLKIGNYL